MLNRCQIPSLLRRRGLWIRLHTELKVPKISVCVCGGEGGEVLPDPLPHTCTLYMYLGVHVYMLGVITPCTCTRGKAIVFIRLSSSVVATKIPRSQALGICVCCNYRKLVDIIKKQVSCVLNCWTRLTSATNHSFSIQHAYDLPTAPTPHTDLTQLRMLDLNVGKGRHIMKCIQLQLWVVLAILCYSVWRVHRVWALESSSLNFVLSCT